MVTLLVVLLSAFVLLANSLCLENCLSGCNKNCMNAECNYAGYDMCMIAQKSKNGGKALECSDQCSYADLYSQSYSGENPDCDDTVLCPLDRSKSCTKCLTDFMESKCANTDLLQTPDCASCHYAGFNYPSVADIDSEKLPEALACRQVCREALTSTGACVITETAVEKEICKNPLCRICRGASSETVTSLNGITECPPQGSGSKQTLFPECSPGCTTNQLGNGVCEESCQTVACRFDAEDCQIAGCSQVEDFEPTHYSLALQSFYGITSNCNLDQLQQIIGYQPLRQCTYWEYKLSDGTPHYVAHRAFENSTIHIWEGTDKESVTRCLGSGTVHSFADGVCLTLEGVGNRNPGEFNKKPIGFVIKITLFQNSDGVQKPGWCKWQQLGDGICDPECLNPECYNDLGDCLYSNNICPCTKDEIGDGECNETCMSGACDWDGGDCFCLSGCPTPLLRDGQCDFACNNKACNYDWGDCECAPGCTHEMLGLEKCHPECNNEKCNYNNGECLVVENTKYTEYSIFTAVWYKQSSWREGGNCPDPKVAKEKDEVYDNDEYERKKEEQKPAVLKDGWESSGEPKYFYRCYSSYLYGHFIATFKEGREKEKDVAVLYWECGPQCDYEGCINSIELKNGGCHVADVSVKLKWEAKSSGMANQPLFSFCILVSLLVMVNLI